MQHIIPLSDGSALRLTTAKYYTPSRRIIHERGIKPDMLVDISDRDSLLLYEQRTRVKGAIKGVRQAVDARWGQHSVLLISLQ